MRGWLDVREFGADPTGRSDSTAAIQQAIDARAGGGAGGGAAGVAGGGPGGGAGGAAGPGAGPGHGAYLPAGRYLISAPLAVRAPGLVGDGTGSVLLWDNARVGTLIRSPSATTERAEQYVSIRDVRLSQIGPRAGGTAIDASGFQFSRIERVLIDRIARGAFPGIGVDYNSAITHYNVLRDCVINVDGPRAIGVRYSGAAHSNVLANCRLLPSTTDPSQVAIYVDAYAIELDRPDIEAVAGTAILIDSGATSNRPTQLIAPYLENPRGTNIRIVNGGCPPAMGSSRFTLAKPTPTARSRTTSLAADPDLAFTMIEGRVYHFRFMLVYDGPASAGDLTVGLLAEGQPQLIQWVVLGPEAATQVTQAARTPLAIPAEGRGTPAAAFVEGLVGPGAGGRFALCWAQRSGDAAPTTLYAGSTLTVEQVS